MDALHLFCPICKRPTSVDLSEGFDVMMDRYEKQILVEALRSTDNNRAETARRMKVPVHVVRHLQMKHGLIPPKSKKKS
jgi:DNA-binding NtrC family response regulator